MKSRIVAMFTTVLLLVGVNTLASPEPAFANGPCADNNVCLYECWLSSSCGYALQAQFVHAGCNNVSNINTLSVKNTSGRKYFVYQSSNCTGSHSIIWPESQGNMNSTWANFNSLIRTVI